MLQLLHCWRMAGLWDARFTSYRTECIVWSFQQASYTSNYQQKILVLSEDTTYRTLTEDTLHSVEHKKTLLIRKYELLEDVNQQHFPHDWIPLRLQGLQKLHKERVPLRPIISMTEIPTYGLAKYLAGLLGTLLGHSQLHISNSVWVGRVVNSMKKTSSDSSTMFCLSHILVSTATVVL